MAKPLESLSTFINWTECQKSSDFTETLAYAMLRSNLTVKVK
jgi:hypothetical protein